MYARSSAVHSSGFLFSGDGSKSSLHHRVSVFMGHPLACFNENTCASGYGTDDGRADKHLVVVGERPTDGAGYGRGEPEGADKTSSCRGRAPTRSMNDG